MSGTSLASLAALISFGVLLLTSGLIKMIFFGLFWVSVLALLIVIMTKKRWTSSDWLSFAAFSASIVVGVLFAAGNIRDTVGVGVVLLGLLFVTMIVNAIKIPQPRKKRKASVPKVVVLGNGTKYHREGCRLVKGKNKEFIPKALAQSKGLKPCGVCKP